MFLAACGDEPAATGTAQVPGESAESTDTTQAVTATTAVAVSESTDAGATDQVAVVDDATAQPANPAAESGEGEELAVTGLDVDADGWYTATITPGKVQQASFAVESRQDFAVDLRNCNFQNGDSSWIDVVGADIDTSIIGQEECDDTKRLTAEADGTVTLTINHGPGDEEMTGTFQFRVRDVTTPPAVQLAVGDQVGPGSPTASAGSIEGFGHRDLYEIEVTAGQVLVIRESGNCDIQSDDTLYMEIDGAGLDELEFIREGDCRDNHRFGPPTSLLAMLPILTQAKPSRARLLRRPRKRHSPSTVRLASDSSSSKWVAARSLVRTTCGWKSRVLVWTSSLSSMPSPMATASTTMSSSSRRMAR